MQKDRGQKKAEADDGGERRKGAKQTGSHVFAIAWRRRWRIEDDDMVIETTHSYDRFLFFAEMNEAFDELGLTAAKPRHFLAMIDCDAHCPDSFASHKIPKD